MYERFYSFSANPFHLTPDSRFFFGSREHRRAMSFLEYGISQREGFVVITGEIGAGKTTLVEQLLATIDPRQYTVARVATTQLGSFDVLCMIGAAFGIYRDEISKANLIMGLMRYFSDAKAQNKYPLIVVDEAQSLSTEALEEIRMLSNLAIGTSAPFQGILLGQPEFRAAFSRPELQQFKQRVIASCHLDALSEDDTRNYIEYRLRCVGWRNDPTFSLEAYQRIHRETGGIPRRVNTLCSRLLLLGYLEETHSIDPQNVESVAAEMRTELGLMSPPSASSHSIDTTAELPALAKPLVSSELESRVERLEQITEKNRRTVARALQLALEHIPAQGPR
jgi:general secretion pathway protein A